MNKKNIGQNEILPLKNTIVKNTSVFYPTPKKLRQLVKPDFSPILNIENKFGLKSIGSYKNSTILEPETPIKTFSTSYLTPLNIEGKDLFDVKKENLEN